MKLRLEQLEAHLKQSLMPIYLLSGDEPLQRAEAADAIRAAAREQGYGERRVLHVEAGFDWGELQAAGDSLSLFAERQLIELRMPAGKPGDAGSKALVAYTDNPSPDNLLLIDCGKLERAQQNSKWFKALDAAGAVIQIWPIESRQLPGWIGRRLRQHGFEPTPEACGMLAERVEGNLLAAAQEVEKLALLHRPGSLDAERVSEAVADSARYDLFELVDTALGGDAVRAQRMLQGLCGEGLEPVLVLWALARELRGIEPMARAVAHGESPEQAMAAARVWRKRQGPVGAALRRHPLRRWQQMLGRAARIDRMIKGAEPGNPWDELLQLTLMMAGVRLV